MYYIILYIISFLLTLNNINSSREIRLDLSSGWEGNPLSSIIEISEYLNDENKFWLYMDTFNNITTIDDDIINSYTSIPSLLISNILPLLNNNNINEGILEMMLSMGYYLPRIEFYKSINNDIIYNNEKCKDENMLTFLVDYDHNIILCNIKEIDLFLNWDGNNKDDLILNSNYITNIENIIPINQEFDHIYEKSFDELNFNNNNNQNQRNMILYGLPGLMNTMFYHKILLEYINNNNNLKYIFRYYLLSYDQYKPYEVNFPLLKSFYQKNHNLIYYNNDTSLQGFGVYLDIKNMEYKNLDDRNDNNNEDNNNNNNNKNENELLFEKDEIIGGINFYKLYEKKPNLINELNKLYNEINLNLDEYNDNSELKVWQLTDLGLQTTQYILNSNDPLNVFQDVVSNFPLYASSLSALKIDESLKKDITMNTRQLKSINFDDQASLYINGIEFDASHSHFNIFELFHKIHSELFLMNQFNNYINNLPLLIQNEIINFSYDLNQQLYSNVASSDPLRIDLSSGSKKGLLFINNIEKDVQYKTWPNNLLSLLKSSGWQLHAIKRNLYTVSLVIDPSTIEGAQLIYIAQRLIQQNYPIRFSITFQTSKLLSNFLNDINISRKKKLLNDLNDNNDNNDIELEKDNIDIDNIINEEEEEDSYNDVDENNNIIDKDIISPNKIVEGHHIGQLFFLAYKNYGKQIAFNFLSELSMTRISNIQRGRSDKLTLKLLVELYATIINQTQNQWSVDSFKKDAWETLHNGLYLSDIYQHYEFIENKGIKKLNSFLLNGILYDGNMMGSSITVLLGREQYRLQKLISTGILHDKVKSIFKVLMENSPNVYERYHSFLEEHPSYIKTINLLDNNINNIYKFLLPYLKINNNKNDNENIYPSNYLLLNGNPNSILIINQLKECIKYIINNNNNNENKEYLNEFYFNFLPDINENDDNNIISIQFYLLFQEINKFEFNIKEYNEKLNILLIILDEWENILKSNIFSLNKSLNDINYDHINNLNNNDIKWIKDNILNNDIYNIILYKLKYIKNQFNINNNNNFILNSHLLNIDNNINFFNQNDIDLLLNYEYNNKLKPLHNKIQDNIKKLNNNDKNKMMEIMKSSEYSNLLLTLTSYNHIFNKQQRINYNFIQKYIRNEDMILSLNNNNNNNNNNNLLSIYSIINPLSSGSQRLSFILTYLYEHLDLPLKIIFLPDFEVNELPLQNFYRFALTPTSIYDYNSRGLLLNNNNNNNNNKINHNINYATSNILFDNLIKKHTLTVRIDAPQPWNVQSSYSIQDIDNLRCNIKNEYCGDPNNKDLTLIQYKLKNLLVPGQCFDISNNLSPPNGLQIELYKTTQNDLINNIILDNNDTISNNITYNNNNNNNNNNIKYSDTLVMKNLGYWQLKSKPGYISIKLANGKAKDIYNLYDDEKNNIISSKNIIVNDFNHNIYNLRVQKKKGMENYNILGDDDIDNNNNNNNMWNKMKSFWNNDDKNNKEIINKNNNFNTTNNDNKIHVFSLATGHLYERLLKIMMLSVVKRSSKPVKFWLLENFLSPSFKISSQKLAEEYNFEVEMVTYQWPDWLTAQSEKQRIIWGYKILFLDVLFPLDLERIIYVDADQVVRADLNELWEMDLNGKPYAYTPFCSSREETLGFQFWRSGYWKDHLQGLPYHISALYVVDLKKFRQNAVGDTLRSVYDGLARDKNSLANLDQDLPNFAQHQVPIHSLPQEWLWCETWCSDDSKKNAKTIDLCNNPLHKESKLNMAKRIINGNLFNESWVELDNEIHTFEKKLNLYIDED